MKYFECNECGWLEKAINIDENTHCEHCNYRKPAMTDLEMLQQIGQGR